METIEIKKEYLAQYENMQSMIGKPQINKKYKWKSRPEVMVYVGKEDIWYQFELESEPGEVWCETMEEFLEFLEDVI